MQFIFEKLNFRIFQYNKENQKFAKLNGGGFTKPNSTIYPSTNIENDITKLRFGKWLALSNVTNNYEQPWACGKKSKCPQEHRETSFLT